MSNVTIPDLPPGAGPTAASQFESVEGAASVRYTAAQIVAAGSAGVFLARANNLSDVASVPTARSNLGVTATGADVAYAYRSNNLSDLASIPTARTNLGITATGADTAYMFRANNLSDVASVAAARTNLGITASGADAAYVWRANNLSDLTNITTARTNLGLGTAAVKNTGTSGNTVPLLDGANTFSGATNVFNGNVSIGTPGSIPLSITRNQDAETMAQVTNTGGGANSVASVRVNGGGSGYGSLAYFGTGSTPSSVQLPDGVMLASTGTGGLTLSAFYVANMRFCTNFAERMRIDAAGNVGIGHSNPDTTLHIQVPSASGNLDAVMMQTTSDSANAIIRMRDMSPGQGRAVGIQFYNGPGVPMGDILYGGSGSSFPNAIRFTTSQLERMRIDAAGNVLIGTTVSDATRKLKVVTTDINAIPVMFNYEAASGTCIILQQYITAFSPNSTSCVFQQGQDLSGNKYTIYSNGGIGNYSANNVNLSDANVKDQITPYSKTELAALEQSFTNVIWGKFKYRDQTHDDWNHGPTAQGVERAFENTAPELVDESELGTKPESGVKHKVIYETDLNHIAHALLASVLKSHASALTRISDLEARLAAVGA